MVVFATLKSLFIRVSITLGKCWGFEIFPLFYVLEFCSNLERAKYFL